jgi:hypothetical protein
MLMPLQTVDVKGAGLELAIPGGPHCIRFENKPGQVLLPPFFDERTFDDAPCISLLAFAGARRATFREFKKNVVF